MATERSHICNIKHKFSVRKVYALFFGGENICFIIENHKVLIIYLNFADLDIEIKLRLKPKRGSRSSFAGRNCNLGVNFHLNYGHKRATQKPCFQVTLFITHQVLKQLQMYTLHWSKMRAHFLTLGQ